MAHHSLNFDFSGGPKWLITAIAVVGLVAEVVHDNGCVSRPPARIDPEVCVEVCGHDGVLKASATECECLDWLKHPSLNGPVFHCEKLCGPDQVERVSTTECVCRAR